MLCSAELMPRLVNSAEGSVRDMGKRVDGIEVFDGMMQ